MRAYCVAGLGYGDEGKGCLTDFLVRKHKADIVVRYNGGPQALHHVVDAETGTTHGFSQFGAGTLAGAATHLSRFMIVDPLALDVERQVLTCKGLRPRISIDPRCVIVTPWHRLLCQAREIERGAARHGSVGLGVGEALVSASQDLALRVGDVVGRADAAAAGEALLTFIRALTLSQLRPLGTANQQYREAQKIVPAEIVANYQDALGEMELRTTNNVLAKADAVVFEGAQGLLIDAVHGFAPYNSWTDATFHNADTLLNEVGCTDRLHIGVLRSYATRHGPGPFPTEYAALAQRVPEQHNSLHHWMGPFRVGCFDMVTARYACASAKPDVLAITHMDRRPTARYANNYLYAGLKRLPDRVKLSNIQADSRTHVMEHAAPQYSYAEDLIAAIEDSCYVPVALTLHGPTAATARETEVMQFVEDTP
jgi:adenylosuccinate synthase